DRIARLRDAREQADLVVTSGGVSRGDFDVVKDALGREGKMEFWEVAIRPGRPLAFGWLGPTPLVGLPGNPVAALVSFEQFVRPAIRKMLGHRRFGRPRLEAAVVGCANNRDRRRCFVLARVARVGGGYVATLVQRRGS